MQERSNRVYEMLPVCTQYLALIENSEEENKFEYLYNQYRKQMYYAARRILHDHSLSEDAVHEAFLKLARNINKVRDAKTKEARNFVMIITDCVVKDLYRKRQRQFQHEIYAKTSNEETNREFLELFAETEEIPEVPEFKNSEVSEALESLSSDAHDIFLLRFGLGFSVKEISEITGFSIAKIEKSINRSKKTLAQKLKPEK